MSRRPALIVGVAWVLVLAACGSQDSTQLSTTASTTAATTTTATTAPTTASPTTPPPTTATTEPTTTTTTTTTTAAPADGTVLVANEQGVYLIDPEGAVATLITGEVASAVDDTRGGLLYQTRKGRNWENHDDWSTVVWWIAKGRSAPSALLVPDPGTDHELTLHDTYRTDTGFVVYTRHEGDTPFEHPPTMHDRLRSYDVDTREVVELYRVRGYEWQLEQASAGGGLITATEIQMDGWGCILIDDAGNRVALPGVPTSPSCFEDDSFLCPHFCSLCGDGTRAASIDPQAPSAEGDHVIVVRDTASGTELARVTWRGPRDEGIYEEPFALSLEGGYLIVNESFDLSTSVGAFGNARIFDLNLDDEDPRRLPIWGWARLVQAPIDIAEPVTLGYEVPI